MKKIENIYEIVVRLIGEVTPIRETNEDLKRLENTESLGELTYKLTELLRYLSTLKNSQYNSEANVGIKADKFVQLIKGELKNE